MQKLYSVEELKTKFKDILKGCYIGCGKGWSGILYDMFSTIKKRLEEEEDAPLYFGFTQIKEKFGTLRIYYEIHWEEINDTESRRKTCNIIEKAIDQAEILSEKTCELCGKPGYIEDYSKGWLVCMCDECREKQKKRKEDLEK